MHPPESQFLIRFAVFNETMRSITRFVEICRQIGPRTAVFRSYDIVTKNLLHFLFRLRVIRHTTLSMYLLRIRFRVYMWLCPNCTDAYPLKRIWVDPDRIEFYYFGEPQRFGLVEGGNWDKEGVRFEETEFYRFIEQRYVEEKDWQETELYQQWKQEIEESKSEQRFKTVSELQSYVESIDNLYSHIDREGYKSQATLLAEDPTQAWESNNDTLHPLLNEIAINIGRDGRMGKKSSGKHRLAVAKILDIDQIPVVVRVRHNEWQAVRAKKKYGTDSTNYRISIQDHPDI